MPNKIRIFRCLLYLALGISLILEVIYAQDFIYSYINYIVGITLFVESLIPLIYDFLNKNYKNEHNHIGNEIVVIILSIVIIFDHVIEKDLNVDFVCIIWGVVTILTSTRRISKAIYRASNKKTFLHIFIESAAEIVLAIMLIIQPSEHINLHIILLGADFILEAFIIFFNIRRDKKNLQSYMDDLELID